MFLDLDRFKQVNDSLGHAAGDDLLREAAQRLSNAVRESDTVSRLGGDEFTLVFPGVKNLRALATLAERVHGLFADPFEVFGNDLHVSCSVGISVFPSDGEDGEALVKHADLAMYRAKASGKAGFAFYSPAMSEELESATEIEGCLRKAIAAGLVEEYRDGVYWVPLAPLRDPVLVVPTIASALGVRESGETPLLVNDFEEGIGESVRIFTGTANGYITQDPELVIQGASSLVVEVFSSIKASASMK